MPLQCFGTVHSICLHCASTRAATVFWFHEFFFFLIVFLRLFCAFFFFFLSFLSSLCTVLLIQLTGTVATVPKVFFFFNNIYVSWYIYCYTLFLQCFNTVHSVCLYCANIVEATVVFFFPSSSLYTMLLVQLTGTVAILDLSLFPLLCENGVLIALYILDLIILKLLTNGL